MILNSVFRGMFKKLINYLTTQYEITKKKNIKKGIIPQIGLIILKKYLKRR